MRVPWPVVVKAWDEGWGPRQEWPPLRKKIDTQKVCVGVFEMRNTKKNLMGLWRGAPKKQWALHPGSPVHSAAMLEY